MKLECKLIPRGGEAPHFPCFNRNSGGADVHLGGESSAGPDDGEGRAAKTADTRWAPDKMLERCPDVGLRAMRDLFVYRSI